MQLTTKLSSAGIVLAIFMTIFTACETQTSWDVELEAHLNQMADSLTQHLDEFQIPERIFPVTDFGAVPDGKTVNTQSIQSAIDACAIEGGGIVLFSGGDFVTGTMVLRSNVVLEVKKGTRILGSLNIKDYPDQVEEYVSIMSEFYEFRQSLIYAEKVSNVGIIGDGEIYFRGEKEHFKSPESIGKVIDRPLGIRMIQCKNVVLKDIRLTNSAAWMQNYLLCENLLFDGITVMNHANYNNDGLDPDGCKNVIVRNCMINAEDDAMCFKGAGSMITENILIENSTFLTSCNSLKIGTDTQGSFRNIIARNITLGGIPDSIEAIEGKDHSASTGITLATVDGGIVENILIEDVEINHARCPIFLRIGNRGRVIKGVEKPSPGKLQHIVIRNVTGERNARQGSMISGIENHWVQDVKISNMNISMVGGGTKEMADAEVEEKVDGYPDAQEFSINGLPAYGFFVRYARNIEFENISVTPTSEDHRSIFEKGVDVENVSFN